MKHKITILMAICVLGSIAGFAFAGAKVVPISMNSIQAHTGDRGVFYVLDVSVPEGVEASGLDRVVLEFAVDVSAATIADSIATPVVGVYPITSEFAASQSGTGGTVAAPSFDRVVPSSGPIALGEHRVLHMDITDIVKDWINEPSSNHGLVIGTLTGPDVGSVTLNEALPGGNVPIRVTFLSKAP